METQQQRTWRINFFGSLTWSNSIDWLVTLCLGGIIALTTLQLGGVRPESQLVVLPLYAVMLVLHGFWLLSCKKSSREVSLVPILFLPFLAWVWININLLSPTPWRGDREMIHFFGAWIFLWVAVNNVRSRGQLWFLALLGLAPSFSSSFNAYYQIFQKPGAILDQASAYPIVLDHSFLGRSTGAFADPESLAAYSLILLPTLIVGCLMPRLPIILRVLALYLGLITLGAVMFSQTLWALVAVFALVAIVPWFCFEKIRRRVQATVAGLAITVVLAGFIYTASPGVQKSVEQGLSPEGGVVRLTLWKQALRDLPEGLLFGAGGGAYSFGIEHHDSLALAELPDTPLNDYLLFLGQYGAVGFTLLLAPVVFALFCAVRCWRNEPFLKSSTRRDRRLTPLRKFFLTVGLLGFLGYGVVSFFSFPFNVPAVLLLGVLMFSILVKYSTARSVSLPHSSFAGFVYLTLCLVVGLLFVSFSSPRLDSHALELQAQQKMEYLIMQDAVLSGDFELLDEVLELYRESIEVNESNADAWIGLGAAILLTHYREPSAFEATSDLALGAFRSAEKICSDYWLISSSVGIALALGGDLPTARESLERAVELAPNSSNANYYLAAFLSLTDSSRDLAFQYVSRALEIDEDNTAARELQQRLSIL